jgi:hypothetical protein
MPASSAISRHVVGLATAAFALSVARPQVALSQNVTRQNKCAVSESLKPTKTVVGTYTQEATRQNAEGIVVLWEILIRTNGSLSSVYRAVREQVRSVDPDQQVEGHGEIVSLEAIMTRQNEWQQARLATFLLGTFSLVALALASVDDAVEAQRTNGLWYPHCPGSTTATRAPAGPRLRRRKHRQRRGGWHSPQLLLRKAGGALDRCRCQ